MKDKISIKRRTEMGIGRMQGVAASIVTIGSNEEERRHHSKCVNYDKLTKKCKLFTSHYYKMNCSVRYCEYYKRVAD